ncbi:hypothetical protein ACJX0J_027765, partial [Zea mays]
MFMLNSQFQYGISSSTSTKNLMLYWLACLIVLMFIQYAELLYIAQCADLLVMQDMVATLRIFFVNCLFMIKGTFYQLIIALTPTQMSNVISRSEMAKDKSFTQLECSKQTMITRLVAIYRHVRFIRFLIHTDEIFIFSKRKIMQIISKEIDIYTHIKQNTARFGTKSVASLIQCDHSPFFFLGATQVKPLIWVEAQIEKHSRSRIELMVKARSQFKERSTATNVEIEVHVPSDATNPNIRTSMGSAAYAPERDAMVWKIKSFPGGKEYMCRAEFSLPSITAEEGAPEKKAPIQVKFEIPYFTVSGIQVVYILGQVRAMDNEMLLRIKQYGLDMMPKILILSVMANMDNVECPVTRLVGTPRWKFFISKIMKSICDLDKTLDLAV